MDQVGKCVFNTKSITIVFVFAFIDACAKLLL